MVEEIKEMLAKQLHKDINTISGDTRLVDDLGVDSLDIVELLMAIDEKYGVSIEDDEAIGLKTIKDIADFVESRK